MCGFGGEEFEDCWDWQVWGLGACALCRQFCEEEAERPNRQTYRHNKIQMLKS